MGSATGAAAAPTRLTVPKSAPTWLAKARTVGGADAKAPVSFKVYLAPRGGAGAVEAAVAAVSTPGSARYRHFLTPAQYHAAYDPTAASVAKVRSFLTSSKLTVREVGQNNAYVEASGSVRAVQKAFGTTIRRFSHDGTTVQANETALTTPADVAPSVLTVTGIDTTPTLVKPAAAPPPEPVSNTGRPCSRYYGQLTGSKKADFATALPKFRGTYLPYDVCGYTGPQLRAAYEGSTALDGSGVTVGIIDAYNSPTIAKDANHYAELNGDGSYAAGQYTSSLPKRFNYRSDCEPAGWYGEQTLDVEAVHAMAPGARIRYYGAASCLDSDFTVALRRLVEENKVSMVSNSYGEPEEALSTGSIAVDEVLFKQAALQGISLMFSSGDSGDELAGTGLRQPDASAVDPYVTAVGGTSTAIGAAGELQFQTGWGTERYALSSNGTSWVPNGFLYGAGGGYSKVFNRPGYQNGVVPASAPPGRAVPDVAMDADPNTGMLVGQTQTFPDGKLRYAEYRIGGTSLASPLFAGISALRAQKAGGRLGFLNPSVYAGYKAGLFTDVKGAPKDVGNVRADYVNGVDASDGIAYSVRTFDRDSSLTTVAGWDDVTGVGVPKKAWFTKAPAK